MARVRLTRQRGKRALLVIPALTVLGALTCSGSAIGAAAGPPPPPPVEATAIALASEPAEPQPGEVVTLVISVSGQKGADKYGVSGTAVTVSLTQQPAPDAKLDTGKLTTDASGAATVRLTLSRTKGRHVVDATAGALTTQWVTDTLAGANLVSRARHGGEIDSTPAVTHNNPTLFFVGGAVVLLLGYLWPYASRQLRTRRQPKYPIGSPEHAASAD